VPFDPSHWIGSYVLRDLRSHSFGRRDLPHPAQEALAPPPTTAQQAVGLLAMDAEDLEDPPRSESLTSLLLQRWGVVPQERGITEVSEVAPFVAPVDEAPVEL
jgi:hypothetical protein